MDAMFIFRAVRCFHLTVSFIFRHMSDRNIRQHMEIRKSQLLCTRYKFICRSGPAIFEWTVSLFPWSWRNRSLWRQWAGVKLSQSPAKFRSIIAYTWCMYRQYIIHVPPIHDACTACTCAHNLRSFYSLWHIYCLFIIRIWSMNYRSYAGAFLMLFKCFQATIA